MAPQRLADAAAAGGWAAVAQWSRALRVCATLALRLRLCTCLVHSRGMSKPAKENNARTSDGCDVQIAGWFERSIPGQNPLRLYVHLQLSATT